jgi:tetratricopeptide (TPR) repeat protein
MAMRRSLTFGAAALTAALLMAASGSWAMMDKDTDTGPAESDFSVAAKDIGAQKYKDAISLLKKVVDHEPRNADAWSMLGFANRKIGKFADALGAYEKALAINPSHLGANEYLGELYYVETGDVAKAEERLQKLNGLCPKGCDEVSALKAAIAAKKGT